MKKFEGLLFCTDLDGTLYTDDKAVSKENLDAISYFKEEGGLFTFITGRVPQTAKAVYNLIQPNAPYGCGNGGGIYDPVAEKYLWAQYLPQDAIELVRTVDREQPEIGIQFNVEKRIYFNKDNSAMERFRALTGVPNIYCHYEDVKEPVLKVVFAHRDEGQIDQLAELLNNHPLASAVEFIRSEHSLYEMLPKAVSKGDALLRLAQLLKIDPAKTIAVGDYYNDVSMVKVAGKGFAVANAVEDVKAVADYITVNNNESAIAAIVDGLDRGIF